MKEALQSLASGNRTARDLKVSDQDLRRASLQRLRADGMTLSRVDLQHAALDQIRWRNCRLHNVSLAEASLCHSALRLCTLEMVQAPQADFSGAAVENSTACGCTFDGANFTGASLLDSDFSRASLRNSNLQGARVTGASFRGADLRGACLRRVDFSDADLRGADLRGADLEGARLEGADLRGAVLDAAAVPEETAIADDFSPAFQDLAASMGPLVERLLREGNTAGLLNAQATNDLTEQLRRHWGTGEEATRPEWDAAIDAILRRTADTGIAPLLEALKQEADTPPQAVADLLENLVSDLKLEPDATMEDLLVRLVKGPNQPPPSRH